MLYSIPEGAARLGITTDALRKRLLRGQLHGEQHGRRWMGVYLPPEQPPSAPATQAAGELLSTLRAQIAAQQEELAHAHEETAALHRRLEAAELERAELRQLVSQAQQLAGVRLLPSGEPSGAGEASAPSSGE